MSPSNMPGQDLFEFVRSRSSKTYPAPCQMRKACCQCEPRSFRDTCDLSLGAFRTLFLRHFRSPRFSTERNIDHTSQEKVTLSLQLMQRYGRMEVAPHNEIRSSTSHKRQPRLGCVCSITDRLLHTATSNLETSPRRSNWNTTTSIIGALRRNTWCGHDAEKYTLPVSLWTCLFNIVSAFCVKFSRIYMDGVTPPLQS
jgi:hypothetical protein